jgi:hypothetical protein
MKLSEGLEMKQFKDGDIVIDLVTGSIGQVLHYKAHIDMYRVNFGHKYAYLRGSDLELYYKPLESIQINISIALDTCECGTKNPMGQGHSRWCKLYRQELGV